MAIPTIDFITYEGKHPNGDTDPALRCVYETIKLLSTQEPTQTWPDIDLDGYNDRERELFPAAWLAASDNVHWIEIADAAPPHLKPEEGRIWFQMVRTFRYVQVRMRCINDASLTFRWHENTASHLGALDRIGAWLEPFRIVNEQTLIEDLQRYQPSSFLAVWKPDLKPAPPKPDHGAPPAAESHELYW